MTDRALVVITRVAVGRQVMAPEARRIEGRLADVPSEEWVAQRAVLLERVTAAALRRVTVPFTWVWRAVPERQEQIREIASQVFPDAVVLGDEESSDAVAPDAESFLTVRVDSDDALLPEAIEGVAGREFPPDTVVDWRRGWKLDWHAGCVAPHEWPARTQGPFFALAHGGRERMLYTGARHNDARRGRHVTSITDRSWIQVIHGGNAMNRWRQAEPLSEVEARIVLERTGICLTH